MEKLRRISIYIKTIAVLKHLVLIWKEHLNQKRIELVVNYAFFRLKHIFKRIQNKKYGGFETKNHNYLR